MITYHQGLAEEHRDAAAALLLDVFSDKLGPILGTGAQAHELVRRSVVLDRCLGATQAGALVGLLATQTAAGAFLAPGWRDLRAVFGTRRGASAAVKLTLLKHRVPPGTLHVEAVVVAPAGRGRGVGSELLARAERLAAARGMRRLTLEVVDTNPNARRLYERLGFRTVRHMRLWPLDRLVGWPFSGVVLMNRPVAPAQQAGPPERPGEDRG